MIDNRLNSETAAKLWKAVAEFLERKGCNDVQRRDSYILYLYASGMGMKEIAERLGLVRERVRQILVREVDGMTNAARMDGYFALQEKCSQLKDELKSLQRKYDALLLVHNKQNVPKNCLTGTQEKILSARILDTNLPRHLRLKLYRLRYNRVWQLLQKSYDEICDEQKLTEKDLSNIRDYFQSKGLDFGIEIPTAYKDE